ncbi:MAG: homoserine kinase [Bacteroidales bacterium]|nr:homoserine kinase [Bacteroidales bacterium]
MKKIKVFAPASIANLGCGFDVMGMALDEVGDVLEMTLDEGGSGISIINDTDVPLPENVEDNVVTPVIRKFFAMTGRSGRVDVRIVKKIYPGSGIGSSAASSAAAAFGINELFGAPLSEEDVVICAMEGENLASGGYHADNAAPAVMGGITLIRGYEPLDIIKLPVPGNLYCPVIHPHLTVSTKEARSILPKEIPMHTAITQWGNVGGLVAGLCTGNIELVGRAMRDAVAEPYRKGFIPGFDELRAKLLGAGALAMNISGSGPSVFALANRSDIAQRVGSIMERHFAQQGILSETYVVKVSNKGARLIA